MADLEIVYTLRRRINRLEHKLKCLTCENVQNNSDRNKQTVARINKIEARLIKLKGIHNGKIYQVYSGVGQRPKTAPIITEMQMKISEIDIGDTITTLKMTPIWFKLDDKKNALKDIIYPTDGTDRNQINTIARYRTIINKSKDFRHEPLQVNKNSTETVIIALDTFARQYGGELSFTNQDLSFSNSVEHTACGVANLGSVHLFAADLIPTAKFSIKLNLNYDRDLVRSTATMKNFILNFNKEITRLLRCKNDFIRVFSIEKIDHKRGMIAVNFGLTTPVKHQTESLARHFQTLVRRSDFRNEKILCSIESDFYRYELIPILSYLQLSSNDFDTHHNHDYRSTNLFEEEQCGNYPYYLPNGWFRHALNLSNKYSNDNIWFGHQNIDGEWPVAFHGTCLQAVKGITRQGLLPSSAKRDVMKDDVIKKIGTTVAGPGIYVATHCNGGADAYTTPFTISNGDQNETFRIVFQCRVRSNSFTTHTGVVEVGEVWRVVDTQAIRPYGLLLKNETKSA